MTGTKIDGKVIAQSVKDRIKKAVIELKSQNIKPCLATILVGENPASATYVKNKHRACEEVGIDTKDHKLSADITQTELISIIDKLNSDDSVHGILVQLPLPKGLDEEEIVKAIDPAKDADGLHPYNLGCLAQGAPGLRPCTPNGIITLLDYYKVPLEGAKVVVIGRSQLVGKPAALLLLEKNATVTICHSRTKDLEKVVKEADVLVVAIGKSEFVPGSWIKPGAVVIDVGIHYQEGEDGKKKITGDVNFETAQSKWRSLGELFLADEGLQKI